MFAGGKGPFREGAELLNYNNSICITFLNKNTDSNESEISEGRVTRLTQLRVVTCDRFAQV